ncbi:MAG: DUF3263 domain-containing protein [Cryobacterium sp.]|nr:DUF3263 domain-containing protein [Cryobacterium sp.]MBX3089431.1 DUF3263 domain-containing protein [Cryobacterium sp.]MBX3116776.1 DUF3263 domain-containing protein [Cryobacterium sp.]MCO5294695.1 DUF3263 domain-containing protein [Homoserinimonas sp.]MCW5944262.1 DUF3263 domain-containing protein [Cryobacterium sp.]
MQTAPVPPDPNGKLALTELEVRILDFERDYGSDRAAKDNAVLTQFGMTPARYYQVLNLVIDSPAALAYDPLLVRRLQRIRESRMRARFSFRTSNSVQLRGETRSRD